MKTAKSLMHIASPLFRPPAAGRLALIMVAAVSARALGAEPPTAPTEPKTHTLFMGVDFSVEYNKQFYRVQDVVGGSFVIKVNGKDLDVRMDRDGSLKVDRALKLADTSVSVEHLKGERAYTPANDPVIKFRAAQGASVVQDSAGTAAAKLAIGNAGGSLGLAHQGQIAGSPVATGPAAGPSGTEVAANRNFNTVSAGLTQDASNSTSSIGAMQDELAAKMYDAMDLTFLASSNKLVRKPYVVVVLQFHEHESKPGESKTWVYATAMDPLDSKPRKVHIFHGGFPRGFELEKYHVHIYDGGEELATTVADNRVMLTRGEAYTYRMLEYVGNHKGATLPAAPAPGQLTAEMKAQLGAARMDRALFVKVTKNGVATGAFLDESCSRAVEDTSIVSVVSDLRFNPALEKGRPVDALVTLRLAELPN